LSKAASTATAVAEGFSPLRSNASDKTTINIAVGVGGKYRPLHLNPGRTQNNNFLAITLLLLALLLFIFRKPIKSFFKKRGTSLSDATRSIWGGESMVTTAPAPNVPRQIYIPTRNMKQQSALVPPLMLNPENESERVVSVNTVTRQERLGLVRDLPPSRDLAIEVTREVEQTTMNRDNIDMARGSDTLDEKDKFEAQGSAGVWENAKITAKKKSAAESEASVRRWRTPVNWVRDQRRRGWGRLSG
jgi:hypothetical protein